MKKNNTNNEEQKMKSILERGINISPKEMQDYVDDKLSKKEQHKMEQQLLNSDFATQAVEGYKNADFRVNIVKTTQELNKEIKAYNKDRGFYQNNQFLWYAAASVILLAVLSLGFWKVAQEQIKPSGDLAMQTEQPLSEEVREASKTTANEVSDADISEYSDEEQMILSDEEKQEETNNSDISETERSSAKKTQNRNQTNRTTLAHTEIIKEAEETEIEDLEETAIQNFETNDVWIERKEVLSSTEKKKKDSTVDILQNNLASKADDDAWGSYDQSEDDDLSPFSPEKQAATLKKKSKDILHEAMKAYENKNYTQANILFDNYLRTNLYDTKAMLYAGKSHYYNHKYKEAITQFEKLIRRSKAPSATQEAEWYLALSFDESGRKNKAKKLYQKIASSSSSFAGRAKAALSK